MDFAVEFLFVVFARILCKRISAEKDRHQRGTTRQYPSLLEIQS